MSVMYHKTSVTLNLFQGLVDNILIIITNKMLKQVQHDVQKKYDTMRIFIKSYNYAFMFKKQLEVLFV